MHVAVDRMVSFLTTDVASRFQLARPSFVSTAQLWAVVPPPVSEHRTMHSPMMDFSKQLASLQRSAQSAAASSSGRSGGGDGGRGGGAADNRNSRKRGRDDEHEHSSRDGDRGWRGPHRDGRRGDDWRPHGGGGYHRGRGHGNTGGRREEDLVRSILAKPHHQTTGAVADDAKKSASAVQPTTKTTKHLALLFLTIDDLPFEHIWRAWLAGAGGGGSGGMTVSVLCHAKYPDRVKSDWLKQRLLIDRERSGNAGGSRAGGDSKVHYLTRRPEWGSVEITRAMIDLVEEGLLVGEDDEEVDDGAKSDSKGDATTTNTARFISTPVHEDSTAPLPPVDQFIFVSETCLPVATLAEVEDTLFGGTDDSTAANASSWLKARNSPNNGYARQQQWDRMNKAIPTENIWKADQWILMIREHAEAVARAGRRNPSSDASNSSSNYNRVELWECFKRTRASDELYFPTVLSLLNIISGGDQKRDGNESKNDADLGDQVANRRITYCDWSMSARNPASFNVLLEGRKAEFPEVVRKAREEGCLFARKFIAGDVIGPGSRPPAAATGSEENEKFTADKWVEEVTKFGKKQ